MNTALPLVSVIVTTKNESRTIASCLESIKNQSYLQSSIETIVVDNSSVDSTKKIAKEFTPKVFDFGPERSAQRNFGVKQAQGKYVLYLDADMILDENVVSDCVKKCEIANLVALYIPEKIIGEGFWIRVRNFERSFYNATVIDCVRFVSRDIFIRVNGFDEALTGPEDWDFDRRIRSVGAVSIASYPIYHDEGTFNFRRYLSKKSYYARSFDDYIKKWGKDDPEIRKQFGFWYRFVGVFCEDGKWKRFFIHPILLSGMYFLRFSVGLSFVFRKAGS